MFQVISDKDVTLRAAFSEEELREFFVSKLTDKRNESTYLMQRVVSTRDYIEALAPRLAAVNPFCYFSDPMTDCFVRKNRQKENLSVRLISARLACSEPGCGVRVHAFISYPEGHLRLNFRRRYQFEMAQKGDEDPAEKGVQSMP